MKSVPMTLFALLAGVLCREPVCAQTARLLGKVVDHEGRPVEGAHVKLVSRLLLFHERPGDLIEMDLETNRRGLFVCKLPIGRSFSAWASKSDKSGLVRFSGIVDDVPAGKSIKLELRDEPVSARSFQYTGLAAWKHRGPFKAAVRFLSSHIYELRVPMTDTGKVTIPPMPGKTATLVLREANGRLFHLRTLSKLGPSSSERSRKAQEGYELPAPLETPIAVVAKEDDKPIAGAEIRIQIGFFVYMSGKRANGGRQAYAVVGKTNEKGEYLLQEPWKWSKSKAPYNSIIVTAKGYMSSYGSLRRSSQTDCKLVERENAPPKLIFRLNSGFRVKGRVLDRGGKAIADLALTAPMSALSYKQGGGMSWMNLPKRVVNTDAEGRFRIDGFLTSEDINLIAVPTQQQMKRMLGEIPEGYRELPVASRIRLWTRRGYQKQSDVVDTGDLSAKSLQLVSVSTSESGRQGVAGSLVSVCAQVGSSASERFSEYTGRRGRLLLLLGHGQHSLLMSDHATYCATGELVIPEKPRKPILDCVLEPLALKLITGIVVDAAGKPVANARLWPHGTRTSGAVSGLLQYLNNKLLRCTTGEDGRFRLAFWPSDKMSSQVAAHAKIGKRYETSNSFDVGSDGKTDVVLTFPGKQ